MLLWWVWALGAQLRNAYMGMQESGFGVCHCTPVALVIC